MPLKIRNSLLIQLPLQETGALLTVFHPAGSRHFLIDFGLVVEHNVKSFKSLQKENFFIENDVGGFLGIVTRQFRSGLSDENNFENADEKKVLGESSQWTYAGVCGRC